ncbi:sugar phosphate isomerase/epimerase [Cohnella sp. REN36]|uniref:sugar phosphate isomerase/epimerase family protein n=1 Tax=Cohnella sp. REN36 TaxID=2887347 RepID=UPI001D14815E|nr:sugar phosphate isomerase/epimerase family protein [Cohnella sp. REN36]MCC3372270.1 sugar phosphate isomerase/epimerase [Cohnella sp. REN36]
MLKSINQWCFPADTSLERVVSASADAGFEAIELNLYEPGGIGLTMDMSAAEAEAVGRLVSGGGLRLRSLSTGLLWQHSLSSPNPEVREQGRRVVVRQLELAELLGADTVLVVPGTVNAETSYDQCYERSQAELRLLVAEAEKRKVRIGVENVWNKFLLSPLEAARYVDELDSAYAGFYFDVGNVLLYGYPEQWIRILGRRIAKIHVKDFKTAVGNGGGFVPLLAGDVNWAAVRQALREIGYDDTLTAEISPYAADPLQAAYDTAHQLGIMIGGTNG